MIATTPRCHVWSATYAPGCALVAETEWEEAQYAIVDRECREEEAARRGWFMRAIRRLARRILPFKRREGVCKLLLHMRRRIQRGLWSAR
jgi:hypothetical protein